MEQHQIVRWLLVPTGEQTAKAIHPGMRSLHDEASRFEPSFPLDLFGLFPTRSDMSGEAEVMMEESVWAPGSVVLVDLLHL
jgi:hypothetical protein